MDDERVAHFRFGSGGLGRPPSPGEAFRATYRLGRGAAGNIGRDRITIAVHRSTGAILPGVEVRNPLAASGGKAAETLDEARRDAPQTFRRVRLRAITAADYAALAAQYPGVQRAAAEQRWSGARPRIHVAIDALGFDEAPAALCGQIRTGLLRYRRIGHELEVRPANLVPVEIELRVCLQAHALRGHVLAALKDLFSNGIRRNGTPGLFHPDNLTFGEPIRVSRLVATAQSVPGVASVVVSKLCRQFEPPRDELAQGLLPLGALEIARCDNDPNYPEHGVIGFLLNGGR